MVAEDEPFGGAPAGRDRRSETERLQRAHPVGRDLEAAADPVRGRVGLEHADVDAGPLEEQSEGRSGDAPTDDDDAA